MFSLGFQEFNQGFEIKYHELIKAIEHLYEALRFVSVVKEYFITGRISSADIDEDIRGGYLEANKCRLYTEDIPLFEEILQPVLSNFFSAWAMNSQLWEQGYTKPGVRSILVELEDASVSLRFCLECMENLLNEVGEE